MSELGEPPRRAFEAPVSTASWSPDGHALFFASVSGGLYVAHAPDFTPALIPDALQPLGDVIWVLP